MGDRGIRGFGIGGSVVTFDDLLISLAIFSNLQCYLVTFGNLWQSLETFSNLQLSSLIFGDLWQSSAIFGNLWRSLAIFKNYWRSSAVFVKLWKCIEINRNGLQFLETDTGIWGLEFGSGVTRYPGLVHCSFWQIYKGPNKNLINFFWVVSGELW